MHTESQVPVSKSEWWMFGTLYTAQGLSVGFFTVTLVAILRSRGVSFDTISQIYLMGFIWPFRFIWAGWIDRWSFGKLGHYRGWVIIMQSSMILIYVSLMFLDVVNDFRFLYVLCFLVVIFSATQDIALDAIVCRRLRREERSMGNSIQISGGFLGCIFGAGVALVAYGQFGWRGSLLVPLLITAIALFQVSLYREQGVARVNREPGLVVLKHMKLLFWHRPGGMYWLAVLLICPMGSSLVYGLLTPILIDRGWAPEKIGFQANIIGPILGVLAVLVAGRVVRKISRYKALLLFSALRLPGIAVVGLLVYGFTDMWSMVFAIGLYFICYSPAEMVLATCMMDRISSRAPGVEYTLQYSMTQFSGIGMIWVGAASMGAIGYSGVLMLAFGLGVLGLLLVIPYRYMLFSDSAENNESNLSTR